MCDEEQAAQAIQCTLDQMEYYDYYLRFDALYAETLEKEGIPGVCPLIEARLFVEFDCREQFCGVTCETQNLDFYSELYNCSFDQLCDTEHDLVLHGLLRDSFCSDENSTAANNCVAEFQQDLEDEYGFTDI